MCKLVNQFDIYEYSNYGCVECPNNIECNNNAIDKYIEIEIENDRIESQLNDNFTQSDIKEMFQEHFPD